MSEPINPPAPDHGDSITALDYINSQLQLESDARETLPYSFDKCTRPLGPLRQPIYSCLTCTSRTPPPPFGSTVPTGSAALCYSCQISCHGDHDIVEIFEKRNVVCECGTEKLRGAKAETCEIRRSKGEKLEEKEGMSYGQNFWGRFCECEVVYKPELEAGTMFQCFLGDVCGEDWFHDSCIVGKGPPGYHKKGEVGEKPADGAKAGDEGVKQKLEETAKEGAVKEESTEEKAAQPTTETTSTEPAGRVEVEVASAPQETEADDDEDEQDTCEGFPKEDFEHFICWRCVEANPWLKRYAGTPGFLPGVSRQPQQAESASAVLPTAPTTVESSTELFSGPEQSTKRKAETEATPPPLKRTKTPDITSTLSGAAEADTTIIKEETPVTTTSPVCKLPPTSPSTDSISLFLLAPFRTHLCHCPACFPLLSRHRCLLEEEETYSPPADSETASESGSLFDRGEKALGNMDRVKAIQGVTAFNALKDNLKGFLKGFAESGKAVSAEDVKAHFAALRGETGVVAEKVDSRGVEGDGRKEGEGY